MRVLITGASVAANAAAYWFGLAGHQVTVIERASAFREGGQNVDVRGAGREVIRRMGLEDKVVALHTGEKGVAFVDEHNRVTSQFLVDEMGYSGFTAQLEILRGDLARTLFEKAAPLAEYRFGKHITAVDNTENGVTVTLSDGSKESFDLLVVAEGVNSTTRELAFPGEAEPGYKEMSVAYCTIPKSQTDTDVARWYNALGGVSIFVRPDGQGNGTSRAAFHIPGPPTGQFNLTTTEQKRFVREKYTNAGWEAARVLDGMDASTDFYFEIVRMIKMRRWADKRVVLLGDAAWCPTLTSGVGTSLALVGAYVLAGEIGQGTDIPAALKRYDEIVRPFVNKGQSMPKFVHRLAHPQSRTGIKVHRKVMKIGSAKVFRKQFGKIFEPKGDVELPTYQIPAVAIAATA